MPTKRRDAIQPPLFMPLTPASFGAKSAGTISQHTNPKRQRGRLLNQQIPLLTLRAVPYQHDPDLPIRHGVGDLVIGCHVHRPADRHRWSRHSIVTDIADCGPETVNMSISNVV